MSSNLKRTKFYFLITAVFCFVVIFLSYNWNLTENIYSISSEISNVRIPNIRLSNVKMKDGASRSFTTGYPKKRVSYGLSVNKSVAIRNAKEKDYENNKIMLNSTHSLQEENNTIIKDHTVLSLYGNTSVTSARRKETEKELDVTDKSSKFTNEPNSSLRPVIQGSQKLISESSVHEHVPNEIGHDFKSFQGRTMSVLEEFDKAKEKIVGDNKKKSISQKAKALVTRPKYEVIKTIPNSPLLKERDLKAFQRIKNRLKNLGLMNSAFLMPRNNKVVPNYNMDSDATSRPDVCAGCFEKNFTKIINEPTLCEGEVELLFMIASTFSKKDSRNAIRKTWCGDCNKPRSKVRLVFVFGNRHDSTENENLLQESKEFHDIVQMDFHDTYANLTYKTMSSLQWSEDYCRKARYVMKTDDDMYVNTELLPLLLKAVPSEKFIGGMCWGPSSPHRDSNSKWYVSFVQYRHNLYPSMCSGTGYIMSRDVISGVLRQSPNVPFFYLEDVYVAICVKKLGLHPVLLDGFKNTRVDFEPCVYRNQIITSHELSADVLNYVWKESRTCPKADLTPDMVYRPVQV